tara:strand:- start:8540 stop:11776 length:3237 start_codon:yes stop_codon:yes gene_type:complete
MALINTSLPNLIQGVSQQPDTLRFDGQCEDQINALSSVADGLKKRPNTRFIKELESSPLADGAFVHFINRDKQERYVLIINNNTLKVYNILTGDTVDSETINSGDYLHIADNKKPRDIFKALTVNDNTFILNTTKNVGRTNSKSNEFTHADNNKALIFVKQGHFKTRYNIKIKHGSNTIKASYGSGDNTSSGSGVKSQAGLIAKKLRDALNDSLTEVNGHGFTLGDVEGIGTGAGETIVKEDYLSSSGSFSDDTDSRFLFPIFEISRTDQTPFEITVSDSKSGTALGLAYKEVGSISDLPKVAPDGFKIKIRGDVEAGEDDYYVKFKTNDNSTTGVSDGGYVEDVGFGEFIQLDGNTLPHKLVNTSPNNFTFGACTWTTKQAGDNDTNPFPSFFNASSGNISSGNDGDRKISNLFFFKNRLGFLSEGSVILSEAGEYFNFFRTTVRTLLDSAPIDVNVASTKVTKLKSAVGFQENLILFGERGQFVLKGGDLLTPKTVSITPVTNYETDTSTTPLELGSYVYFPFTRGGFSGIREFSINANSDTYDSVEITGHVPKYIPSTIMDMVGSTAENAICALAKNETIILSNKNFETPEGSSEAQASSKRVGNNILAHSAGPCDTTASPSRDIGGNGQAAGSLITREAFGSTFVGAFESETSGSCDATRFSMGLFRFENVDIQRGAEVRSSKLSLILKSKNIPTGGMTFALQGIDVDNSPALTKSNYQGLLNNLTTATVSIDENTINSIDVDAQFDLDVKDVVQEIVNRSGWSSGNAITLMLHVTSTVPAVPVTSIGIGVGTKAGTNESANLNIETPVVDTSIQKDMFVYKYYWEGQSKVLASWSKFTFPFTIVGFDFIESDIFIVCKKSNKTILVKMPMEEKLVDTGAAFNTYLDLRESATVTNGQITLSFTPESDDVIQVYTREDSNTGTKAGALIPCTVNGTTVTVDTSHNNTPVWVGVKYTMSYTFSEQVFRQRANQRKSPSGYQRHFLKGGTLFFDDTASFKVEVTPKARQTYNNVFSSNIVGSTVIGTLPIESGSFSFPIMSSAKDTTIKIVNDSALPGNFQSAEFESFIHTRSRRV